MKYLELDQIILDMKANPAFASIKNHIYDAEPVNEDVKPYIILTVISDPNQSVVDNRARVEVRVILESTTSQSEARVWYNTLNDYFVWNVKMFSGKEVWKVEMEDRQLFPDEMGNKVVLVDYYFNYLT